MDNVTLGKNVWIGKGTIFCELKHPPDPETNYGIQIGDNAVIGEGSTILAGVMIGANAKIGAGSVVTKDVPEHEIWAGNPAKRLSRGTKYSYEKKDRTR